MEEELRPIVNAVGPILKMDSVHNLLVYGIDLDLQMLLARELAKSFYCANFPDGCTLCSQIERDGISDVQIILPEKTGYSVSKAREIIKTSQLTPVFFNKKLFVLLNVDELKLAAPTLLKTLEEPPNNTKFILLAYSRSKVPITVRSRSINLNAKQVLAKLALGDFVASKIFDKSTVAENLISDLLNNSVKSGRAYFECAEKLKILLEKPIKNGIGEAESLEKDSDSPENEKSLSIAQILTALENETCKKYLGKSDVNQSTPVKLERLLVEIAQVRKDLVYNPNLKLLSYKIADLIYTLSRL